jgi:integrase
MMPQMRAMLHPHAERYRRGNEFAELAKTVWLRWDARKVECGTRNCGTRRPASKKRILPVLPELRAAIEASPSGQMVYLVTASSRPFTAAGFGNRFRDWCNEAGLNHCSAHGLRKAGATIAADNGATAHQLMAIYGWETLRQAEVYTRNANRARLANEAMHLLVPRERNKQG